MSHPSPEHKSQKQDNLVKDATVGGDLIFAPQQIDTYIETQIVEISVDKITQQPLIKISPYKGLKRFNLGDREYFFGRDTLISKLFNAVIKSNFSLVLGASGSGKSSVVRAGLIPELKKSLESQKFYDFIFTPNQDPFESLYRCLLSEEKDYRFSESDVDFVREGKPNTLPQLISKLKKNEERWFIFIDQFEQLFINTNLEKRNNFIQGIVQVAKKGDSHIRIVLAMRSDFLEQFSFYPTLGAIANKKNIHLVTEMYPDELRQAIEQPAAKNGVVFEKGLVEQIIKEVEGQKGYLPLLQYTLDLLWEKECTTKANDGYFHIEDRILNKVNYAALGGVRGALQKRVNEIYTDICEKNKDGELVTKQIFLKLVNIVESESGSRAVSRRAYHNEFVGEAVESNLKRFIDENLLVSNYEYSSEDKLSIGTTTKLIQNATIEIAHEILLSSWDKLKRWLEEEKEAIILKNWLVGETRRWLEVRAENKSKASEEFLKGSRLDQIVEFRDKNAFEKVGGLVEQENEFIDTSVEWRDQQYTQRQRTKLFTISGLTVVTVISLLVAGVSWWNLDAKEKNDDLITHNSKVRALWSNNPSKILALKESIKVGKELRKESKATPETRMRVVTSLREIVYSIKQRNSLEKHGSAVNSVAFSPEGNTIATASDDNTVKLWNLQGEEIKTLTGHNSAVNSVAFSPDGNTIATASDDNTVKLWNFQGEEIKTLTGHDSEVYSVAFSPDGNTIATASLDKTVKLWNLQGQVIQTLGHRDSVNNVAFSPDGNTIATSSLNNTVKLWNLQGQVIQTLTGHGSWVYSVAFSPDGNTIATASWDKTVKLWNLQGQEIKTLTGHGDKVSSVAFSPDGNTIATGSSDNTVKLWNFQGEEIRTLTGHGSSVSSVAFSPDGKTIATASSDKTVKLLNFQGEEIKTLTGHDSEVYSVAFSPDGNTIATASRDKMVKLWNFQGEEIKTLTGHGDWVYSVAFSPDGNTIATASDDDTVKLWNFQGEEIKTLTGHDSEVNSVAFSPDGNTIATASDDDTVKLWNFQGEEIKTLTGHGSAVNSVAFSPDGNTIATASDDDTVKLWNFQGEEIKTLTGHDSEVYSVAFSPDGNTIATASRDKTVKLWNFQGEEIKTLTGHDLEVHSVAFSPDGNTIATASFDKTVKLWNFQGEEIKTLTGHGDWVYSVVFSPDGNTIATASDDNTVKLWNFDLDDLLVRGCNWARDYLKYNAPAEDRNLCDGIDSGK
ncbi:WD-40 repeat protein (plasmid) [Calothrix parasitica NIES-267]|uniref:WD-40 repeat protein n=1 Tax=Calothrix parasitica NIES-267 TaxID=1973488 RepID=A0A1Z4M392_9CYAN|nr:WD-40 repeat protein [Calothrix parasitica NIES-267]